MTGAPMVPDVTLLRVQPAPFGVPTYRPPVSTQACIGFAAMLVSETCCAYLDEDTVASSLPRSVCACHTRLKDGSDQFAHQPAPEVIAPTNVLGGPCCTANVLTLPCAGRCSTDTLPLPAE